MLFGEKSKLPNLLQGYLIQKDNLSHGTAIYFKGLCIPDHTSINYERRHNISFYFWSGREGILKEGQKKTCKIYTINSTLNGIFIIFTKVINRWGYSQPITKQNLLRIVLNTSSFEFLGNNFASLAMMQILSNYLHHSRKI